MLWIIGRVKIDRWQVDGMVMGWATTGIGAAADWMHAGKDGCGWWLKYLKVQMDTQVGCYMQVTYNRWYDAIRHIMTNIDIRDAENNELVEWIDMNLLWA
jgi:hypothetical protein